MGGRAKVVSALHDLARVEPSNGAALRTKTENGILSGVFLSTSGFYLATDSGRIRISRVGLSELRTMVELSRVGRRVEVSGRIQYVRGRPTSVAVREARAA